LARSTSETWATTTSNFRSAVGALAVSIAD
jgi:hypothetical protein